MIKRRDKRFYLGLLGAFVGVALFAFLITGSQEINKDAEAANLANFDAGYIISDYQMSNYNSMSEAEIQAFLTSKNSCSNTSYSYYLTLSANKNYTWHWANGHFVCLSEELFGDGEVIGSGETAAHIIWQAAQDYQINPQVLIVLIQKETGLITDPIPNNGDYRKATGYGCPDTAACSEKYYGFKNQVRSAAALFRQVLDGGWTNYPLGTNYIQYHPDSPDSDCGGSYVNIKNLATSALYRYTPYQPNSAALAAGYGSASDGCSSYGNRNFYNYFEDWFGGITTEIVSSEIVEDEYIIKTAENGGVVLDIDGGVSRAVNGTNIQIYASNDTEAQVWKIVNNGDGTYSFVNPATGKVLDVASAGTTNGSNVQLYQSNGTCAQKWKIVRNSDTKTVTIYSACSDLVLDVAGGGSASGTNVQIYRSNGTAAQKWQLVPTKKIEGGRYILSSKLGNNLVIDIAGGVSNATNGTNIQIYNSNGTLAQKWEIIYNDDGYYTIKNPATGKVLDVAGAGTTNGSNVQLYQSNGTCAQKWQIIEDGDYYVFYSACSGKALDVNNGNAASGENVQIFSSNGTAAQRWKLVENETEELSGTYEIQSKLGSSLAIDIAGGVSNATNGTNIQIYNSNETLAQEWEIIYNDDGYYTIKNPATGKVLDVAGAGTTNGSNVQLYQSNGTCAQKWEIVPVGEYYAIFSACSGKALDVKNGSATSGANVQIYTSNGTAAQRWKLVKK